MPNQYNASCEPVQRDPVGRYFNAIIIPLLIPLALKGVKYRPMPAEKLLMYNLLIYGLGGIIAPFIGIKIIDIVITTFM